MSVTTKPVIYSYQHTSVALLIEPIKINKGLSDSASRTVQMQARISSTTVYTYSLSLHLNIIYKGCEFNVDANSALFTLGFLCTSIVLRFFLADPARSPNSQHARFLSFGHARNETERFEGKIQVCEQSPNDADHDINNMACIIPGSIELSATQ